MSNQTDLFAATKAETLACECNLRFKKCTGNCDHRYKSANRESFKALALEVGADNCFTGLEYTLEIPGPLLSEPTLRIIRWCGVRSFAYKITYNEASTRTVVTVYAEVSMPGHRTGINNERVEYLEWLSTERDKFVKSVWDIQNQIQAGSANAGTVTDLRVGAENILIAYDQLRQYYKEHGASTI